MESRMIICRLIVLTLCHFYGTVNGNQRDTPCYLYACYCREETANCSYNGKSLMFIPSVNWKQVEKFYFKRNFLPNITKTTFEKIKHFNIVYLNLEGNQITSIARKSFTKLKYLKTLILSDNTIPPKSLENVFSSLPSSLGHLYLNNMGLTNLQDDFFDGLRHTHVAGIHMAHNNLTIFDQTVTRNLSCLVTLNLQFNHISTLVLTYSKTLSSLWLDQNQIKSVPDMCPRGSPLFPQLFALSLEFNNITFLNPSNYRCLKGIERLFLSGNRIDRIPEYAFSHLSKLHMLKISHNKANALQIKDHAFKGSLEYLNLSYSNIGDLPYSTFLDIPSLQTLDISGSQISNVKRFSDMLGNSSLTSFCCRQCGLHSIPKALRWMDNLKYLSLEDNYIDSVSNHMFDYNLKLTHLSLRKNNISTVSGFAITYSLRYQLQYISLEFNPFICDCRLLWFKDWIRKDKNRFQKQYMNYRCASPPREKGFMILNVGRVSDKICLWEHSPFITSFSVAGTVLIIFVLFALLYKWRWKIRYLCISRRQPRSAFTAESRPLLRNDAYVVYCDDNYYPWIRSELMPNIEERRSLRLGIRQRDFDPTRHKVSNIVDNLRSCRKVIVVLSNGFFKDNDSKDELSLVVKCLEDEKGVLVVVLLEDIDDRYMSVPLYRLLQKNEQIRWPTDARQRDVFWRSLGSALEDSNLHSFT